MKTVGLTLGKFAPFHRGHQLVVETALREMDAVIVLLYDSPEVTDVPLPVRSAWVRTLYPAVRVIEAWSGPTETGNTPEIQRRHEEYILHLLNGQHITHFYSSEFYGDHVSAALGAVNRQVDAARTTVPISGTRLRAEPFRYRAFLDPLVYRDLVTNVVFMGAPSTGKTTLTERMAREFNTAWMPEYGREYWETHQVERRLTPAQLVELAEGHLLREEALRYEANGFLFTDTNALTTYLFSHYYHGFAEPRLAALASATVQHYDLVFLCDTDIPYDDTWDRSGAVMRETFQRRIIAELSARRIPYLVVQGDLDERAAFVRRMLGKHRKWRNILETLAPVR